jgi:PEP-CTERM motif
MKRIVLLALLAMALPFAAFADESVDFTNSGGLLSGSASGMSLSGSELIAINGLNGGGLMTGGLGGLTFSNGTHNYTLTGSITGTWEGGATVNGATVQLTINTGKGFFNGKTRISSGDTNIVTTIPEPGTLGLLGTGLIGLAGALHRKFKS